MANGKTVEGGGGRRVTQLFHVDHEKSGHGEWGLHDRKKGNTGQP